MSASLWAAVVMPPSPGRSTPCSSIPRHSVPAPAGGRRLMAAEPGKTPPVQQHPPPEHVDELPFLRRFQPIHCTAVGNEIVGFGFWSLVAGQQLKPGKLAVGHPVGT